VRPTRPICPGQPPAAPRPNCSNAPRPRSAPPASRWWQWA
jgi:hypothetical protein